VPLPDPRTWRLHLKSVTLLDIDAIMRMPTTRTATKDFLEKAWRYMCPGPFEEKHTSRTIKATTLREEDVARAVAMGKFEACDARAVHGPTLPLGVHGVNAFAVPELKGRRRLITEPHLNATISDYEVPRVEYPSRLARRQSLRYARYMLQIDFEAFYNAIPLPEILRNKFVFRSRGGAHYRLCTLPTGARWSVAVGQAVTWTIVDIDTPVTIHTMIDNILVAACAGQEAEFLHAVRRILARIRAANLLTSPCRDDLAAATDEELLRMATGPTVFLGEEYAWFGDQRLVRNSAKTVAKLMLASRATAFTHRSFVSVVSLVLFALHTTRLNPARCFALLRAYRGVYRLVTTGRDWDDMLEHLDARVHEALLDTAGTLIENAWWAIADERRPTYDDHAYDAVVYTDASYGGWGAIAQHQADGHTTTYQQRWVHDVLCGVPLPPRAPAHSRHVGYLNARHSAHAEPRTAQLVLRQLVAEGLPDGSRVALVTDHFPIAHAQQRLNGFGGIGRGYALNRLFEYAYDLAFHRGIEVDFFYVSGPSNPADHLSRNFGDGGGDDHGVVRGEAPGMRLPALSCTYCPLCETDPPPTKLVRRR